MKATVLKDFWEGANFYKKGKEIQLGERRFNSLSSQGYVGKPKKKVKS